MGGGGGAGGGGWLHIFGGVAGGNGNDSFQNSKRDNYKKYFIVYLCLIVFQRIDQ